MKIIDSHIHSDFSDPSMILGAKLSKVDYSKEGLLKEMELNQVILCASMQIKFVNGNLDRNFNPISDFRENQHRVIPIIAINPHKSNKIVLRKYEALAKDGKIKGFKVYLGYYYHYPSDKVYLPYYEIAKKYDLPVFFHTGDTYSESARIKYSNPHGVDDVAVLFPEVKFVICHFGEPHVLVAAQIVRKNSNVYADLSGLLEGDAKTFDKYIMTRIREGLELSGYDRIMYGSDWPLAPMKKYISFIKKIVPKKYHKKVFYENAKKFFKLNV